MLELNDIRQCIVRRTNINWITGYIFFPTVKVGRPDSNESHHYECKTPSFSSSLMNVMFSSLIAPATNTNLRS